MKVVIPVVAAGWLSLRTFMFWDIY